MDPKYDLPLPPSITKNIDQEYTPHARVLQPDYSTIRYLHLAGDPVWPCLGCSVDTFWQDRGDGGAGGEVHE